MIMKHNFLFLIMLLFAFTACSKNNENEGPESVPETDTIPEKVSFSYEEGVYQNVNLPYRKAIIASIEDEKAALVLYLHGGTSKGSDNEAQMNEHGIDSISNYLMSHHINSVFLVPQCATDKSWGGIMNEVVKSLIDDYIANGNIDINRIYILGGSMGGTGTWGMVSDYPDLFAAAMPVAGNPSRCDASSVANTPVFTVMGTSDVIMNIDSVSDFINQLILSGGKCMFEIEDGWTHEITCIESYTTERLDWIFNHQK